MGRPVILGNGELTVGLDECGLVHDFYYPYVGLENLATSRITSHKVGIWVENNFSWVDDGSWKIIVDFETTALVSVISMENDSLKIKLDFNDFVDCEFNAFIRKVKVTNLADRSRDIRLFMHQVFEISRSGRADTALFVPEENYILDYKGRYSLMIYGQDVDGTVFDQFAVGNYGIEGKEGTFKDAEDGELSGCPVEHGGVDSVIRFSFRLEANESSMVNYWIIATDSQSSGERIHDKLKSLSVNSRLETTRTHWSKWLDTALPKLNQTDRKYLNSITKSLMVIKSHVDKRGGIIASCDSSIYNYGRDYYSYVWPRDAAYAVWPLIRLGYKDEAKQFFEFCRDILNEDGYLMHKYQPDRAIGSTWHPLIHGRHKELAIQEDETALVIYMLGEYVAYTGDSEFVFSLYKTLIQPAGNFMASFIDNETNLPHASYDLWEQKFLTTTYTVSVVYQALMVASELADRFQFPVDSAKWSEIAKEMAANMHFCFDNEKKFYIKGYLFQDGENTYYDNTLDISNMYGPMMFGGDEFKIEDLRSTVNAIENVLLDKSPSGGCPRYENDGYFQSNSSYLGNPWFVTTLWMAQYYIKSGQNDKGSHYIDWAIERSYSSGVLSEQVNPDNGSPISVMPLVWSHAELLNTILDLTQLNNPNQLTNDVA